MPLSSQERFDGFGRKAIIGLSAVGLILLAVAIGMAVSTLGSITDDTDRVEATLARQSSINRLTTFNEQIAAGRRGFLLQPDPAFTRIVIDSRADYEAEEARLEALLKQSPAQLARLHRIRDLSDERDNLLDRMFANPARAFQSVRSRDFSEDRGVEITQLIRGIADRMSSVEQVELSRRNRAQLDSLLRFYVVGGAALAVLLGLVTAIIVLILRYNRDLGATQSSLRVANEGLEDAVDKRTAELTRANAEIQRFAYIVSHDLRSPLVNVLGFTSELDTARKILHEHLSSLYEEHPDLKSEDAWLAVEEDLPEALGFIRTSTEKMDRLINSILELSRQGRRTLNPELLDMTELAGNVAATMTQRAEDAGASLSVSTIPPLESDRIAVEQILSNLVENALKYLSPDRAGVVQVEGRRLSGKVEIAVIDNGRGIAPEDHDRIFDLFRRAGQQDQPGEGLGLANVRALAYRLGGTIDVESQLGEGARFILTLPERFVAAEPV